MPLGNRAEDYGVALAALEAGATLPDQAAYDAFHAAQDPAWLRAFHERFYAERADFAERDHDRWLARMAPYAPFVATLRRRAGDAVLAIATSKDHRSVSELLGAYGLADLFDPRWILDKEAGVSKRAHLERLAAGLRLPFKEITFLDDKVNHLESVAPLGVRCALAAWGYNGPRERSRARALGFLVCRLEDAEAQLFGSAPARTRGRGCATLRHMSVGLGFRMHAERTPNPNSIKWVLGEAIAPAGATADFQAPVHEAISPLAAKLFAVKGVTGVFLASHFVTVTKAEDAEWTELAEPLVDAIKAFAASGASALGPEFAAKEHGAGGRRGEPDPPHPRGRGAAGGRDGRGRRGLRRLSRRRGGGAAPGLVRGLPELHRDASLRHRAAPAGGRPGGAAGRVRLGGATSAAPGPSPPDGAAELIGPARRVGRRVTSGARGRRSVEDPFEGNRILPQSRSRRRRMRLRGKLTIAPADRPPRRWRSGSTAPAGPRSPTRRPGSSRRRSSGSRRAEAPPTALPCAPEALLARLPASRPAS